jgi:transcription elongation factor Elf1
MGPSTCGVANHTVRNLVLDPNSTLVAVASCMCCGASFQNNERRQCHHDIDRYSIIDKQADQRGRAEHSTHHKSIELSTNSFSLEIFVDSHRGESEETCEGHPHEVHVHVCHVCRG